MDYTDAFGALMLEANKFSEERPIILRDQSPRVAVSPSTVIIDATSLPVGAIESILWRTSESRLNYGIGAAPIPIFGTKKIFYELRVSAQNSWHELSFLRKTSYYVGFAPKVELNDITMTYQVTKAVYGHLRLATWDRRFSLYEKHLIAQGRCDYDGISLMSDGTIMKNGERVYPSKMTWNRERPWILAVRGRQIFQRVSIDVSVDGDVFVELLKRTSAGLYK